MRKGWKHAEATVESVVMHTGPDSAYSEVVFMFKVDDGYYGGTFTAWKETFVGDKIAVSYDPANPDRNNLTQQEKLKNWALAVFFIAFGIWFLYSLMHLHTK
jgi:hypothetical protein